MLEIARFQRYCWKNDDLCPYWRRLFEVAHEVLKVQVGIAFPQDVKVLETTDTGSELLRACTKFNQAREELECECRLLCIEYPDLSLEKFRPLILQY